MDGPSSGFTITRFSRWFLIRLRTIAEAERQMMELGEVDRLDSDLLARWKVLGFTDRHIADALGGFPAAGAGSFAQGT